MLKTLIKDSGESRDVWAKRFGISRPYLSMLENGLKRPSLELAVRIERETDGAVPATSWVPVTDEDGAEDAA